MPKPQFEVYVPLSAVFPNVKANVETLRSLLRSINRRDALLWCARLNLALSGPAKEHEKRQQLCIERFLSPDEIARALTYAQKVKRADNDVVVFFRGQILELMRWVALYSAGAHESSETFGDPEVRRRFAQAALICGDILDRVVWGTKPADDTAELVSEGDALGLCRKAAQTTAIADLAVCLGRGWALYREYLPKRYPSFDEEFRGSTGISVEQYFHCLSMVLADSARPAENAGFHYNTVLQHSPYNGIFQQYMALESQTPEELHQELIHGFPSDLSSFDDAPPYNKRLLLNKPILRADEQLAVVMDPVFFGESATAGPLFHVLMANQKMAQTLFSAFGYAFEDYVNGILKRMFPKSVALADRLLINEKIIEHGGARLEIDACINDVLGVVLIETKAAWMREEAVLTDHHQPYMEHLKNKYVEEKGIGQLARRINVLADPRQLKTNEKFAKAKLIYPMIIVHDRFVPTLFLHRFLYDQLKKCLEPDQILESNRMKKGSLIVTPPILLDIDTLEGLEASVQHHGFVDMLDDYLRDCSDGATSFGNYIRMSPKYEQHFRPHLSVVAKYEEAFNATARQVFPESSMDQA